VGDLELAGNKMVVRGWLRGRNTSIDKSIWIWLVVKCGYVTCFQDLKTRVSFIFQSGSMRKAGERVPKSELRLYINIGMKISAMLLRGFAS
jgi:hypothetical protein